MQPFDLEESISAWTSRLGSIQQLEPGDAVELESHLRDAIDGFLGRGIDEQTAFETATEKINRGFDEALEEFRFRSANQEPKSRLLSAWWIPALLPNILKVTLRSFKRQPGFSLINIVGLAIGIASCLLIFLYVQDELSYDTFHEKADRIYRVDQTNIWANFEGRTSSTGPGVAGTLADGLPEIETIVRVNNPPDWLVTIVSDNDDINYFEEPRVLAADATFFDVFTSTFLEGDPETALDAPFSVVITEKIRQKYFSGANALGKSIQVGNLGEEVAYTITGVVEEMPRNSHFRYDLLASLSSNEGLKNRGDAWVWTVFVTYVVLKEDASIESVRKKLPSVVNERAEAKLFSVFGMNADELNASGRSWEAYLTPLTDIHLRSENAGNRIGVVSDILYVYVFSVVALLIIVLASINFMNLSSARSVHRAKEVGIRKTLGSRRVVLVAQFLSESVLFSFVSLVLALIIVFFAIAPFNDIAAKQLAMSTLWSVPVAACLFGLTLLLGLLSGAYPALYLTSFNPIQALKSRMTATTDSKLAFMGVRNLLVVFQFAISIILISCSVIIYQQLRFVQNSNLGFDKENVLVLENVEQLGTQAEAFKQQVEQAPGVVSVARTNAVPPRIWYEDFAAVYGSDGPETAVNSLIADDDLIATMGFELVKGKGFEAGSQSNDEYVLLNELAVERLPFSAEARKAEAFPIGESILFSGNGVQYTIIGVLKDFNTYSLRDDIQPLALFHESSIVWAGPNRFLTIRFANNADINQLIAGLEKQWRTFAGSLPFDHGFLDDQLYEQYESEQQIAKIVSIFTGLAIFIAVLGLLGLVSFLIEKKTKEIGVRKVMGASPASIVLLLSKDLSRLIVIAAVIAVPVAWMMMNTWLEGFRYRVGINVSVFFVAGIVALSVAAIALSFQTVKAATRNPVISLRSE